MKIKKLLAALLSLAVLFSSFGALAEIQESQNSEQTEQGSEDSDYEKHICELKEKINLTVNDDWEKNEISLMSAGDEAEFSLDVIFPYPTEEDGYLVINLYELEKDGNKILNSADYSNVSSGGGGFNNAVHVEKGSTRANYSASVKKGSYIIEFYYSGLGSFLNSFSLYYSENGAAHNKADADIIQLTDDLHIDMTFPAAERTISGTITLNKPAPQDGELYINCENTITWDNDYYDITIPISAGQTEVNYSIGVNKGTYRLALDMEGTDSYKYYSVMETADLNYENCYYLDTNDNSLSNINFTYSCNDMVSFDDIVNNEEYCSQNVSITLPEALSESKEYTVYAEYEESDKSVICTVNAGETTGSGSIYIPASLKNDAFVLTVRICGNIYYYTENGLTADKESAKKLYLDENSVINIDCTDFYILKGTVSRNGVKEGDYLKPIIYAETGEYSFSTSVTIDKNSETAPYALFIPEESDGQELTVYTELLTSHLKAYIDSKSEAETITVSETMSNTDLTVKNIFERITGTLELSEPAENNNVMVKITSDYYANRKYRYTVCEYCIPKGEKSIEYAVDILTGNQDYDSSLKFTLSSSDMRFNDISGSTEITGSDLGSTEIQALPDKNQKITGTIKNPENIVPTNAVSYIVSAEYELPEGNIDVSETYSTIPKGEMSQEYSIDVPGDASLVCLCALPVAAGMLPVSPDNVYYTPEDGSGDSISLANGLENADITLEKGIGISGKIIIDENAGIDYNDNPVCYINANGNNLYAYKEIYISDYETPYMFVFPSSYEGEDIVISYSAYRFDDIYSGTVYYAGENTALDEENAEILTIGSDDISDINLKLVPYKMTLNMDIYKPDYDDYSDLSSILSLRVILDNGEQISDIQISDTDEENHYTASFMLPDLLEYNAENFKLCYDVSRNGNYLYQYEGMYVNPDGSCTFDETQAQSYETDKDAKTAFTVWDNSYFLKDAADKGEISFSYNNISSSSDELQANLQYTNNSGIPYTADAIIAAYDENNILKDINIQKYVFNEDTQSGSCSLSFSPKENAYKYKIFLWSNSELIRPIIGAEFVPVVQ